MKARKIISVALVVSLLMNLLEVNLIFGQEAESLTIAVVDFTNTKRDPELDYLVKGIPESVLTYLGKKGEVRIVERGRLEAALEEMKLGMTGIVDEQTAVELGKAVGAAAVMLGSFLQVKDKISIYARLVDVKTSEIITAEQVQGGMDEIFDLMDQTAEAMSAKLVGRPIEWISAEGMGHRKEPGKPVYKQWWFWGILGVGVAGGAAYMVMAGQEEEKEGTLMITVRFP